MGGALRCEGWTVADVVLHLAQTNEMAIASLDGTMDEFLGRLADAGLPATADVDEGAAAMVERERGAPTADLHARWADGSAALHARFVAADLHDRVTWVAGQLTARTLASTRLAETWIHAGDIVTASGPLPEPTERLSHIARLAWRTVPYAFARAGRPEPGPVTFDLAAPDGDRWAFAPRRPPGDLRDDGPRRRPRPVPRGRPASGCRRHRARGRGPRRRGRAGPRAHVRLTARGRLGDPPSRRGRRA